MSAPGYTTPLRTETFENLQLNAGIFLKDFDYSNITDATDLKTAIASAISSDKSLGATRGGGSFVVTREIRSPEVDGKRYGFVGDSFVDSTDARLSTTLIEMTPQNIVDAFGSATATTSGKKTTIKLGTAIDSDSYLSKLCWIGDLADGRLVLISLDNALNTADFNLTFTDKGEGTLPVEFHAHQSSVEDYDYAPFEIVYFDTDSTVLGSITVSSAAGSAVGGTALTTTNSLGTGEQYVYKVGSATDAPAISYHQTPDYSWESWDGTSDLNVGTGANGKKATVAVLNSNGKAIKAGTVTLTVKTT